jgi:hypothetical protein
MLPLFTPGQEEATAVVVVVAKIPGPDGTLIVILPELHPVATLVTTSTWLAGERFVNVLGMVPCPMATPSSVKLYNPEPAAALTVKDPLLTPAQAEGTGVETVVESVEEEVTVTGSVAVQTPEASLTEIV